MQDEIRDPVTIQQADGTLVEVLAAATGKPITYYNEYPGAWRLVWRYTNWTAADAKERGPVPLATDLPFRVRDRKAAAYLAQYLNIIAEPDRGAYLRESDRPAETGRIMLADIQARLAEDAGPILAAHPEWAPGPVRKATRKAPPGWTAADYPVYTDRGAVRIKYGYTRGTFGACGAEAEDPYSFGAVRLTYVPAGLLVETVRTYVEAAVYADAYGAILPAAADYPAAFGAPPSPDYKDPIRQARESVHKILNAADR